MLKNQGVWIYICESVWVFELRARVCVLRSLIGIVRGSSVYNSLFHVEGEVGIRKNI